MWMDGKGAASVSNFPQVFSHGICFLVEQSSVDTFVSHDYNQYWGYIKGEGRKEKKMTNEKIEKGKKKSFPP